MSDRDQRFLDTAPLQTTVAHEQSTPPTSGTFTPQSPKVFTKVKNKIGRLHLFAAFCENPANVTFETQEQDEHVLVFLRKSKWINLPWIVASLTLGALPLLIYLLRDFFATFIPPINVVLVIIPIYYVFVILYAFSHFVTWYYNAALITDKRIIDINFHQIVLKDVAETKLALVQDVSYKQDGVIPNICGYGFVLIQTAGTLENFEFHNLPQPARVVEIVEDLIGGKRFYEP